MEPAEKSEDPLNASRARGVFEMECMEVEKIKDKVKTTGLKHIAIIMDGNRRWAKDNGRAQKGRGCAKGNNARLR